MIDAAYATFRTHFPVSLSEEVRGLKVLVTGTFAGDRSASIARHRYIDEFHPGQFATILTIRAVAGRFVVSGSRNLVAVR